MKHVQVIRRPNGDVQLYLRKKGLPSIRLTQPLPAPGHETGSALEAEVRGLIERLAGPKVSLNTLGDLLRLYELEDPDFGGLRASTKKIYLYYIKEFSLTLGAVGIHAFTPSYVLELRRLWATKGHRAANLRLQVLKNVLKPAMISGQLKIDPFPLVGQVRRPSDLAEPHVLWPAEVVDLVIRAALASRRYGIARAVAIARYTGARRGDLVSLTKAVRDAGRFRFRSGKKKVPVDALEDPELTRWLAEIPDTHPDEPRQGRKGSANVVRLPASTLVFNLQNGRYTESGLGQGLGKLIADMHERGAIDSDAYDLHGLRHTRGVELALAGCTDAQGAAILGHASPSSFAQYRRQADRIRMSDDAFDKVVQLRLEAAEQPVEQTGVTEV